MLYFIMLQFESCCVSNWCVEAVTTAFCRGCWKLWCSELTCKLEIQALPGKLEALMCQKTQSEFQPREQKQICEVNQSKYLKILHFYCGKKQSNNQFAVSYSSWSMWTLLGWLNVYALTLFRWWILCSFHSSEIEKCNRVKKISRLLNTWRLWCPLSREKHSLHS